MRYKINMALSKERRGEIAELIVENLVIEGRIKIPAPSEMRRRLGVTAKKINIPIDELIEFAESILLNSIEKGLEAKK